VSLSSSRKQSSKSVKSNPTLADVVTEANGHLADTEAKLGPQAPQLTADDKRRSVKFRKGAERIIPALAALLRSAGIDATGLSVDQMTSDLQRAQTLQPLQARLQSMLKRVGDEVFTAQASSLGTAMSGYAVLQHMAKRNGDIATQLEPISSFFAYRNPDTVTAKAKAPKRVRTAQSNLHGSQALVDAQAANAQKVLTHLQDDVSPGAIVTASPAPAPVVVASPPPASPPPAASTSAPTVPATPIVAPAAPPVVNTALASAAAPQH
jgi:hypothetical protein